MLYIYRWRINSCIIIRLKELMEDVETLRAERQVMESELKSTNPDMKTVFLQAAANGSLNEPLISAQSLGRTFGPLQQQVNNYQPLNMKLV